MSTSVSLQKRKKYRIFRLKLALSAAVVHTLLCVIYYYIGFFRTTLSEFIVLFGFFWVINLIFVFMSLKNTDFLRQDLGLFLSQVIWAISCLMITVFLTVEFRPILLMFCLLTMAFGVFKFTTKALYSVAAFCIFSYGLVVGLFLFYPPEDFVLMRELINWGSFSFIILSFALTSVELSRIRDYLNLKSGLLEIELHKTEEASLTDALTGAKNRRFILDILDKERAMVDRNPGQYSFSVGMLDIDFYKNVNDLYGHIIGDYLLKSLVGILNQKLREMDFFARIGGDEFLLVLPLVRKDEAKEAAERIRDFIEKQIFKENSYQFNVNVTIGITEYKWPETIDECMKRVDEALYQGKYRGRNQVVVL